MEVNGKTAMIICNSRKFLFIHIHKTGGSSFEIAAAPTLAWNDILLGSTELGEIMNRHYMTNHGLSKHSSLEQVLSICAEPSLRDYRFLTIVRHPLKRAISLYRFIATMIDDYCNSNRISLSQVQEDYESHKSEYWPLCWPASEAYILTAGNIDQFFFHPALKREAAMATQFSQVSLDGTLPSKLQVIKLEELKNSHSILAEYIGAREIPHENKSASKTVQASDLSRTTIDFLSTLYSDDMRSFAYA